jgi:DNA-binding transcriptional LysR family regulator
MLHGLLRARSLTRAAAEMETTQPTLSKALRRLRLQFDDPLFIRDGQRMEPTAKALALSDGIASLLRSADMLHDAAATFDPRRSDRLFSVLLTDTGIVHFLPLLLAHCAVVAPGVRLRAVPLDARQFERKLETGEADLALGAFRHPAAHLRRQILYTDGYSSLARGSAARIASLATLDGFCQARHVLITGSETGHAAHSAAHRALTAVLPESSVALRVPSFLAGAVVAASTDAVVTVPNALARALAGPLELSTFAAPVALPQIQLGQYWHERFHRDAASRWLRGVSLKLFQARSRHIESCRS